MSSTFNYTLADAQAMPVTPLDPAAFDFDRYQAYALDCDRRYAQFMRQDSGVLVWQRVRVAEVFRDGCADMQQSLRWQLGGLTRSLAYRSDAPTYLEPWYGIGTIAAAFGSDYDWPEGQAPVTRKLWRNVADVPDLQPLPFEQVPVMQHTLRMIEYFLEQTRGRLPISWCDVQSPLNVASGLVETSAFYMGFVDYVERIQAMLDVIADTLVAFTRKQSELIGEQLVRPGHTFASSYSGQGLGMSTDDLVMISPRTFARVCLASHARAGEPFGGAVIHSCGNWSKWIPAVRQIANLRMVDGAFSPQTDPHYNVCEEFRDAFAGSGVIVHARMVGDRQEVLDHVRRLWKPGMKLVVVTYVQDVDEQHRLYDQIHELCV